MIGIINYYLADNYGAVLQCYALQKTIDRMGFNNEIIFYDCKYISQYYKLIHYNNILRLASDIVYLKDHLLKKIKFTQFRKKYITTSNEKYNKDTINKANEIYKVFITGSDQVFNYTNTDFDKTYFLEFVEKNKYKCSYGASFGFSVLPENKKEQYKYLLESFDFSSFRENSGVNLYTKLTGKSSISVLDPTLIAPNDIWTFETENREKRKYILVYMLERSCFLIDFIKILQEKTGFNVIYIGSLVHSHRQGLIADYKGHVSPEEFVNLFKYSEYIVTNSFHGTAFSIIFKKNFFVEKLKKKTITNDRFDNLLIQIGLEQRIIDESKLENINLFSNIDYIEVEKRLDFFKGISLNFLKRICDLDKYLRE